MRSRDYFSHVANNVLSLESLFYKAEKVGLKKTKTECVADDIV